jgi:hypothetical protein
MRAALFWDTLYRRFGKTYRVSSPTLKKSLAFLGLLDPWRWDREVVPKRRYRTTTVRCVISQESADLIYIAAEA